MYPHRIRLRGPWEAEPLDPPGETRRVTMPASLAECGLGDYRRVRFRRRFGRPRQIDAHERVWLVGEGIVGRGSVKLNGFNIGEIGPGTFEFLVPEELAERNELTIELTADSPDDGLRGDVALEIRCSAYLRTVRSCARGGGRLRVGGAVAGESDGPLEIYVLADGRTVGYTTCQPGASFDVLTDPLSEPVNELRVELVNGAVVWYVGEIASGADPG